MAQGMNLPPKQCYPLQFSLHFLGKPRDIKYEGVKISCILPQFASQPLGISTDRIFCPKGFKASIKGLQGYLMAPVNGNPNTASMIKVLAWMCYANFCEISPSQFLKCSGVQKGMPLSWHRLRQLPFLPYNFLKVISYTEYFIIFKCLAATNPSPPLFPGPTSTEIVCQ